MSLRASLVAQLIKNLPAVQETRVQSLSQEDPLEEEMATHSSILAFRKTPWTEEPGRLNNMSVNNNNNPKKEKGRMWSDWGQILRRRWNHLQLPLPRAALHRSGTPRNYMTRGVWCTWVGGTESIVFLRHSWSWRKLRSTISSFFPLELAERKEEVMGCRLSGGRRNAPALPMLINPSHPGSLSTCINHDQ